MRLMLMMVGMVCLVGCPSSAEVAPARPSSGYDLAMHRYSEHLEHTGKRSCLEGEACLEILATLEAIGDADPAHANARGLLRLIAYENEVETRRQQEAEAVEENEAAEKLATAGSAPNDPSIPARAGSRTRPSVVSEEEDWSLSVVTGGDYESSQSRSLRGRDIVAGRQKGIRWHRPAIEWPPPKERKSAGTGPRTAADIRREMEERDETMNAAMADWVSEASSRTPPGMRDRHVIDGSGSRPEKRYTSPPAGDRSSSRDISDVTTDGNERIYHDQTMIDLAKELEAAK